MKKILTTLAILLMVVCCCRAQSTNVESITTTQLAKLTNGMSLAEFQTALGIPGRVRENSSPFACIVDFDFNGDWVMAEVKTYPPPSVVKSFRVIKDGLTIPERQTVRSMKWHEWVEAHQRRTNSVSNQTSDRTQQTAPNPEPRTLNPGTSK